MKPRLDLSGGCWLCMVLCIQRCTCGYWTGLFSIGVISTLQCTVCGSLEAQQCNMHSSVFVLVRSFAITPLAFVS